MTLRVGLLGALLLAGLPALSAAQDAPQTRRCRQVLPSDARRLLNALGQEIVYFMDPVRVLCSGGLRLEADSAVMNRATSSIQLVGRVVYQDTLRRLTAEWANYVGERDQLLARGDVVLRNLDDESTVRGQELDYLRATETRPRARMIVRGGRPYAVIPPRRDTAAPAPEPDTAASTEIWADRMEFEGEELFRGLGNVELRRGDMTGGGATATFDQAAERMTLTGDAHVENDRYRLEGAIIDALLSGQELRTVTADREARVESEDLTVDSERIRIGFTDGRLERLEAWNPQPDSVARALANARDFRLRADSIDARADSLGIQEVRAVGRAYGERDADQAMAGVPGSVARDWIQGDTILGFFTRRPVAATAAPARPGDRDPARMGEGEGQPAPAADTVPGPPDPDATPGRLAGTDSMETVLERIIVIGGGGPALSLYRMAAEDDSSESAINFMQARKITLFMERGDVSRVEAEGPLEGVYLAPAARQRPEAAEGGEGEGGDGPREAPDAGGGPAGGRP